MRIKYKLLFFLIITFSSVKSQVKTITVLSQHDNSTIPNVLVYFKTKVIGETDISGKTSFSLTGVDSLTFVKNGFKDYTLPVNKLDQFVTLIANDVITLKEVKITPINAEILLNRVSEFMKSKDENGILKPQSNYYLPKNIQVYNKFTANNDTLHYLNNRFSVEKSNFKINNQNKIIKKFETIKTSKNIYQTYSWKGKSTNFANDVQAIPLGIYSSTEFTNFFYHQDLFEYKIEEDDTYYKLIFKQKKKSNLSNIEGYLIIDRLDYGIHEFESKLLDNKPFSKKVTNFSNSKLITFKVLNETYHFKYSKQNDRYILDNCSKSIIFIADNGDLKNISFVSTIQVEKTIDFIDKELKNFNMFNWECK